MRFLRLDLLAFGCFEDTQLDFSTDESSIDIVFGPNEAGKTTAMRALTALCFDIPAATVDAHTHDKASLSLGGSIKAQDGTTLEITRRKGKRQRVADTNDQPVDEDLLTRLLGGFSADTFRSTFALTRQSLREGGNALLRENGDVGMGLFGAALGTAALDDVVSNLEKEADGLFRPAGKKPAINSAIRAHAEQNKRIRDLSLPSEHWHAHDKELRNASEKKRLADDEIQKLRGEHSHLKRLESVLRPLARRKQVTDKLSELDQVAILSERVPQRRNDAISALQTADQDDTKAQQRIEALEQRLQGLVVPDELLRYEKQITDLYQRLSEHENSTREHPKLTSELADAQRVADELCASIRPGLSLDEADKLRLSALQEQRIYELSGRYPTLCQQLRSAQKRLKTASTELGHRLAELGRLGDDNRPQAVEALRKALQRAQMDGDLEAMFEDAQAKHKQLEMRVNEQLSAFTPWDGTLAQLRALPVPLEATVDEFSSRFEALKKEQDVVDAQLENAKTLQGEQQRRLATVDPNGALPTENELKDARKRRNQGFKLVKRRLEGKCDSKAERDFDPRMPLIDAFEQSVDQADDVADRLRLLAERIAQRENLVSESERLETQLSELDARKNELTDREQNLTRDWYLAWQPSSVEPLSCQEMKAWLQKRASLLQQADELDNSSQQVQTLARKISNHHSLLDKALAAVDSPLSSRTQTLAEVVEFAGAVLWELDELGAKRKALEQNRIELDQKVANDKRELARARADLASWRQHWRQALGWLELDARTPPTGATAVLASLGKLFAKREHLVGLRRRIDEIEQETADFRQSVSELSLQLAPELQTDNPEHTLVELYNRLAKARTDQASAEQANHQLAAEREAVDEARGRAEIAKDELSALFDETGCKDVEELEQAERSSELKARLQSELESLDQTIAERGAAHPDTLAAECEDIDPDELTERISSRERQIEAKEHERSEIDQTIGRERAELGSMDGTAAAIDQAEQAESNLAEIARSTNRYIQVRLASILLRQAIERFRNKHQGALLNRASQLFSMLTANSFTHVSVDYSAGSDDPRLVAQRDSGSQVGVAGLSDGTRDQLYLALRLASLERYYAANEPIPLVLDDLFVNFDDHRARLGFQALASIACHTQVIFFTHHSHLIELAAAELEPNSYRVHQLVSSELGVAAVA